MRYDRSNIDSAFGSTVVSFDSNGLITLALGAGDANLRRIEALLGVEAVSWGGCVSLSGESAARERAHSVLRALYRCAKQGQACDENTVDAIIGGTGQTELVEHDMLSRLSRTMSSIVESPIKTDHTKLRNETSVVSSRVAYPNNASSVCSAYKMTKTGGKIFKARNASQQQLFEALLGKSLVFAIGAAGSGKTFAALAAALQQLRENRVSRAVFVRPVVEAGENLGFLPGTINEKIDPYFRPVFDALHVLWPHHEVTSALDNGQIELAPLAYMRGRTLENAFVVLDEGQNCTVGQMAMFLTRMGQGSVFCVTGDPSQCDLPKGVTSGLADAVTRLNSTTGVASVRFTTDDVVRHPLVRDILKAYGTI